MVDINRIAETLQDAEIAILNSFKKTGKDKLEELKGLSKVEFLRAGMWLKNKGLIEITKKKQRFVSLDILGKQYAKASLPELKLLVLLRKKPRTIDELEKHLSRDELRFGMGYLKQKGLAEFKHGSLCITDTGKRAKLTLELKFLIKLARDGEVDLDKISPEEKYAYLALKKRKKIIKEVEKSQMSFTITPLGKQALKHLPEKGGVGILTPSMVKTGSWKDKKFRRYDVSAPVPNIYQGKKQPYYQFVDQVRKKLVELGFTEMTGPLIETAFWNFDALFQPQNHPARDWTDTYNLKQPKLGSLPSAELVKAVKDSHEKSWKYNWSAEEAKKLVPRAHDTAMSPRYLSSKNLRIPGKYFNIARCYRPDVLDATHLIEFNQLGGFVIGNNLTFKHLLGLLKQFAIEFTGATEVEFVPDYYPFTEPSVQLNIKHPELGWIELAGAGTFRPELTEPLGIKQPVIAWGIGIDRLAMFKLGVKDIRYLFSQDLDWLRKQEVVI